MLKKIKYFLFIIIYFFYFGITYGQNEQEYLGIIKLNDSSFISYKLNIIENNETISGYSITDIGGEHETKSSITGNYNHKTNVLLFKEVGIIYTKSEISDYDFCFIYFEGKVTNINSKNNISGEFKGKYSDGSTCINGEISLKGIDKITKRAEKVDNIIQKSKRIDEHTKTNVSVLKTLDSLGMNVLKANQNLSTFSNAKKITLKISDAGKVDGDKISIYLNDTILLKNYIVTKNIKEIDIPLKSKKTIIKVHALNLGSISPNTAKIEIINLNTTINTLTSLKKDEKTLITIIKKDE